MLHPLLEVRPVKKELVLVITTDKGLCGALNTNLLRETHPVRVRESRPLTSPSGARAAVSRTAPRRTILADFR